MPFLPHVVILIILHFPSEPVAGGAGRSGKRSREAVLYSCSDSEEEPEVHEQEEMEQEDLHIEEEEMHDVEVDPDDEEIAEQCT
jgi:hypothetical protein